MVCFGNRYNLDENVEDGTKSGWNEIQENKNASIYR